MAFFLRMGSYHSILEEPYTDSFIMIYNSQLVVFPLLELFFPMFKEQCSIYMLIKYFTFHSYTYSYYHVKSAPRIILEII